jgi:hypothetical protein
MFTNYDFFFFFEKFTDFSSIIPSYATVVSVVGAATGALPYTITTEPVVSAPPQAWVERGKTKNGGFGGHFEPKMAAFEHDLAVFELV